jgi:hypothetical protein
VTATSAPAPAQVKAMARPMPRDAPVTTMTFPCNENSTPDIATSIVCSDPNLAAR